MMVLSMMTAKHFLHLFVIFELTRGFSLGLKIKIKIIIIMP